MQRVISTALIPFEPSKALVVPEGFSLRQMVFMATQEEALLPYISVFVDGELVTNWEIVPRCDSVVQVCLSPGKGGDKNPLRMLMSIAVIAMSMAIPGMQFGAANLLGWLSYTTGISIAASSALISGVVMTAGMMLVDALVPVKQAGLPSLGGTQTQDSPTMSISGMRNRFQPGAVIPRVFGRHKMAPLYAAKPFTELVDNDQYLRCRFCWGYGVLQLADLKIGETPIGQFEEVQIETRHGYPTDTAGTLFPSQVNETTVGVLIEQASSTTAWAPVTTESTIKPGGSAARWSLAAGSVFFIGTDTGVFRSGDAGVNWTEVKVDGGPLQFTTHASWLNNVVYIANTLYGPVLYVSTDTLVFTSVVNNNFDKGASYCCGLITGDVLVASRSYAARYIPSTQTWASVTIPDAYSDIVSIGITQNGAIIWQSGTGLYKSVDSGATWVDILGSVPVISPSFYITYTPILANNRYTLLWSSGVAYSDDNGTSWVYKKVGGDQRPATGITTVGVTVSVTKDGSAYYSTDYGTTWFPHDVKILTDSSIRIPVYFSVGVLAAMVVKGSAATLQQISTYTETIRVTEPDTDEISVDVTAQQLCQYDGSTTTPRLVTVFFDVWFRETGSVTWLLPFTPVSISEVTVVPDFGSASVADYTTLTTLMWGGNRATYSFSLIYLMPGDTMYRSMPVYVDTYTDGWPKIDPGVTQTVRRHSGFAVRVNVSYTVPSEATPICTAKHSSGSPEYYDSEAGLIAAVPASWAVKDERNTNMVTGCVASVLNGVFTVSAGTVNYTQPVLSAASTTAVRKTVAFRVPRGQYDVKVVRTTPDSTSNTVFDDIYWSALRSIRNEPTTTMTGLCFTDLRIKATDQLSGAIDELTGVAVSVLPDYDTSSGTWVDRATANPASVIRHILLNAAENAGAVLESQVDTQSLIDFWLVCNQTVRTFNHVVDYDVSALSVMQMAAAAGRASVGIEFGKWRVVMDEKPTLVSQMFTPRNTSGYAATLVYPDLPHGWRIPYLNADKGYVRDELLVFSDGYTAATATKFETLEIQGKTSAYEVWQEGRYHLANAVMRRETHKIDVDFEYLKCMRGDWVKFQQDVIRSGLASFRAEYVETSGSTYTAILPECSKETVFSELWNNGYSKWVSYGTSVGEMSIVTGGVVSDCMLRVGNDSGSDQRWLIHSDNILFDSSALYRLQIRVRRVTASGDGAIYAGWAGVAADGVTLVNIAGANTYNSQHYHCVASAKPAVDQWTVYTGFAKGSGAAAGTNTSVLADPGKLHPSAVYVRPLIIVNYNCVSGIVDIDEFKIEKIKPFSIMESGKAYGVSVRNSVMSVTTHAVTTTVGDATHLVFTTPPATTLNWAAGDLCSFGESGKETKDLIVTDIEAKSNQSATITCKDLALAIYDYDRKPIMFTGTSVNTTDNTIAAANNNMQNGDAVRVTTNGTLPAPLDATSTYYIASRTSTTVKLATDQAGTVVVDLTTQGSSDLHIVYYPAPEYNPEVSYPAGYASPVIESVTTDDRAMVPMPDGTLIPGIVVNLSPSALVNKPVTVDKIICTLTQKTQGTSPIVRREVQ